MKVRQFIVSNTFFSQALYILMSLIMVVSSFARAEDVKPDDVTKMTLKEEKAETDAIRRKAEASRKAIIAARKKAEDIVDRQKIAKDPNNDHQTASASVQPENVNSDAELPSIVALQQKKCIEKKGLWDNGVCTVSVSGGELSSADSLDSSRLDGKVEDAKGVPSISYMTANEKKKHIKEFLEENKDSIKVKMNSFIILSAIKEKYPDLVGLIITSESINHDEKQYWFDILPSMTIDQINKLYDIMETENLELMLLNLQYAGAIRDINSRH